MAAEDHLGRGLGTAIIAIAIGGAAVLGISVYQLSKIDIARIELEKAKVERGYVLHERDLNNNGLPEKFYVIDGRKAFLSIDGKNLENKLKQK